MLQTVAKYLWGDSSDDGQSQTENNNLEQESRIGENLETHQEEGWVVVRIADKENSGHPVQHTPFNQHPCHQVQAYHTQSPVLGGDDSLSSNSLTVSDTKLQEKVDTIDQSIRTDGLYLSPVNTEDLLVVSRCHDYGFINLGMDLFSKIDFIPKSLFSDCSSNSHDKYHPCSHKIEPRLIAFSPRVTSHRADVKPGSLSLHEMFKNTKVAQRRQGWETEKVMTRNKCKCQNRAREYESQAKGNNRKNKHMQTSGFKSSRFSQNK